MAPEQVLGQTLDHRADLFSLGSVLYELASGRPPFRAANTIAVLRRVSDDTPRPMQEIIPEIPDWLVAIVTKLHAKKPEDRFQSAKEVADLLARCQSELQLTGKVTSLQGRPVAPRQEARTSSDSPKRPDSDAKVDRSLRVCDDLRIPSRSLVRVCGRRDKAPSEHPHSTSRFVAGQSAVSAGGSGSGTDRDAVARSVAAGGRSGAGGVGVCAEARPVGVLGRPQERQGHRLVESGVLGATVTEPRRGREMGKQPSRPRTATSRTP